MRSYLFELLRPICRVDRDGQRYHPWVVFGLALVLGACGSTPEDRPPPPFVSEEMRASFGTIGVLSTPPIAPDEIETPPYWGEATLEGMLSGAAEGASVGRGGNVYAALIALAFIPIAAVAGGISGWCRSPANQ